MPNPITKPVAEWDEADLQSLIDNGIKESISLDYKRSNSLLRLDTPTRTITLDERKAEISKDISAFANSAGGILIYGIAERNNLPTEIDGGLDPTKTTREWLEQVINSNVQPRITGLRINQVELTKTKPGNVAYVVDVPQAQSGGPHQAADKCYYKRFNFQSVAMEDYEVKDVMRRSSAPNIQIGFQLVSSNTLERADQQDVLSRPFKPILIQPFISNLAPEPVEFAVIALLVDARLRLLKNSGEFDIKGNTDPDLGAVTEPIYYQSSDNHIPLISLQMNWGRDKMPLFFGPRFQLCEPLMLGVPEMNALNRESFLFGWQAQAPGMVVKTGIEFMDIESYRLSLRPTNLLL